MLRAEVKAKQRLDELEGHLVAEVSSLGKVGGIVDIGVGGLP